MELNKPLAIEFDWGTLPPLWERHLNKDNKPGVRQSGYLIFKHPNEVELMRIDYTNEVFACIFTPRQAHAVMMAVAALFNDCKTPSKGESDGTDE